MTIHLLSQCSLLQQIFGSKPDTTFAQKSTTDGDSTASTNEANSAPTFSAADGEIGSRPPDQQGSNVSCKRLR